MADTSTSPIAPEFAALYAQEMAWVWTALRRLGAPVADLEDLTHDVFLAAHHSFGRFDASRPIRPWLMGIAFRVLSDFRSRKRHQHETAVSMLELPADDDIEGDIFARQNRALLMRALDSLDEARRAVFVAHDLEELPMAHIADAFQVPLHTAYSRLKSARSKLVLRLQQLHQRGGTS